MTAPRFYRVKLARNGAWVALKVWHGRPVDPVTGETLDRSPRWYAVRDGLDEPIDNVIVEWIPYDGLPFTIAGEPITEAEYQYLSEDRAWARQHAPNDPAANPRKRINLNELPPLKFTA